MHDGAHIARLNRRLTFRLALVAAAMFGFGFLLAPLYSLFCEIAGIGIRTAEAVPRPAAMQADRSRLVTVEFVTAVNEYAPWEFRPAVATMRVHPGELYEAQFLARNLSGRRLVGQAIPSVAPAEGAKYLRKTECFCFNSQEFAAGEDRTLGLQFYVDPSIPTYLDRITLSYTMFVNQQVAAREQMSAAR